MDFNTACINLNINSPFSHDQLKRQYRIMALKYHPDKHPTEIDYYTDKFKEIGQSYEFLTEFLNKNKKDFYPTEVNTEYNELFVNFLSTFFTNNHSDVQDILKTIINDCHNLSIKLFEDMDKEKEIQIFEFITKYQHILYIPSSTVEKIKIIINEKMEHDNIVLLNPCLEDLISDNVYILEFEDEKYFVPLWHDEIYYKHKKNDLVIKCIPDLSENISLDVDNNIIIEISYNINTLLNEEQIVYELGKERFIIPIIELKILKKQNYIFKKRGISHINHHNIYDNTSKSNIIFIILLHN